MTRSNKVSEENSQNPKGYGPAAQDPVSLLLDVSQRIRLRRRSLSLRSMARIAAGAIIKMGSKFVQADTALVNYIRISAISICSLVFAVVLYHSMFGTAAVSPSAHSTLALANPLPAEIIVKPQTVSPMELSATPADEGEDRKSTRL